MESVKAKVNRKNYMLTKTQRSAAAKKGWRNRNPIISAPTVYLRNQLSTLPIRWRWNTYSTSHDPLDKKDSVEGTYKGRSVIYRGQKTSWGSDYRITAGGMTLSVGRSVQGLISRFKG